MKGKAVKLVLILLLLSAWAAESAERKEQNQSVIIDIKPHYEWLSSVGEHLCQGEYKPSTQSLDSKGIQFAKPRLHFANRAHNLRAYFYENIMEITPRAVEDEQSWTLILHFDTYDQATIPKIVSGEIVYENPYVTQKFSHSPAGIEQNITLMQEPTPDGNITLVAKIITHGLQCHQHSQDCLIFSNEICKYTYRVINVVDARNRSLNSIIEYDDMGNLAIPVPFSNVVYPVQICLLISSDHEGIERTVISSKKPTGSKQTPHPDWTAEPNQAGARFGYSVSSAGDVNGDGLLDVIIGAPYFDGGQTDEGRVYVYHNSSSGLQTTPAWIAESDQAYAFFGGSVSQAGDVNNDGYDDVIVGAHLFDNAQNDEGRAFVYHGSASGLSQTADWTAEPNQDSALFANCVSTAGDVNGDGYSDVIIGAYSYDGGQNWEGRAYVYHGSASGLSPNADWIAESNISQACFGYSVSHAGDVNGDAYSDVIVSAPWLSNGQPNEGRIYAYHGSASGLSSTPGWITESNQYHAFLGYAIAHAGDVNGDGYSDVITGSLLDSAFVYQGSASGLSTTPNWAAGPYPNQGNTRFGQAVSSVGDVTGDGYGDVIVGAYLFDNGQFNEGCAFVYYGSTSGLSQYADWMAEPDLQAADFGYSVSTPGDLNNDGFSDVAIGAPSFSNGQTSEGRVFVYYARHNISADTMIEPAEHSYEEFSQITPSAIFKNTGFFYENDIPVTCVIKLGTNTVYSSTRTIDSLAPITDFQVIFDDFTLGMCGSHYQVITYSTLPGDTLFSDDTLTRDFVTGRYFDLPAPGSNAWKYPNADSGFIPEPTDPNWILATQPEIQRISALDNLWWITAGAIDSAHQDLQLYGFQLPVPDTLIEELTVEWWGRHRDSMHQHCAFHLWNNQENSWSRRAAAFYVMQEDIHFTCNVPGDSINIYVDSSGYMYGCALADYAVKSSCPLLFSHNGSERVFIGDVITGCDIGMWLDRVLGTNIYLPSDYDEYVRIDGADLQPVNGRYRLSVNEMLQEVSYLDEVKLYVIDHPAEYDVYPHEALLYPGYQGLSIHTSEGVALKAAFDENGRDVLSALAAADRMYVPFERSGITGFAKPFSVTVDVGELVDPASAVLYLYGSTRFQDSDEIGPVSDIYRARARGMRLQNPRVEVLDSRGRWCKVRSCGMPRGHQKTVTYPLYDEAGRSIFVAGDHRLRITFYSEVYLDKAWVSCHSADDYRLVELVPELADLHYYGYADYFSPDGKYPGDYCYERRVMRDYANVVGYYTRYGDVRSLLDAADSRFVIMGHGDELSLEFDAGQLPELAHGWQRDFIFASKGFYKMARAGRAYAYSVDPLPFYGMRADMSAHAIGYYPYDPSPGLLASLLGRIYARLVWDYPFSLKDAFAMIKLHFFGEVKDKYPAELVEYCHQWNTRHVGAYYPDYYADLPPHQNLERVPLSEHEGDWATHLAFLGIPFGGNSLLSNYVRVWIVTTIPLAVQEHKLDVPSSFSFEVGQPNPFNEYARINYTISEPSRVCLRVYDLNGRLVRTLVDEPKLPGSYTVMWGGIDERQRRCSAGVYFVNLSTGAKFSGTKKIIFMK